MKKLWLTLLIFLLFIVINIIYYRNTPGDDLSSSYIACRLLGDGKSDHLYSFNPEYFHIIDDSAWVDMAQKTSFNGFLHPYVQTPLWAYILGPLCEAMNFPAFNLLFLALNFIAIAGTIWLTAYQWAPSFLSKPVWLAGFLAVFSLTTPLYYTAFLNQTHPLILFATILAIFLASRKQHILAGFALAVAATIKITPAIIVIYWLISGKRKSAGSFLAWWVSLNILTLLIFGVEISLDYLSNLNRISNVLLVSYNNQSLVAWLYSNSYNPSEILNWRMFSLPVTGKILGYGLLGLVVGCCIRAYRQKINNPNLLESTCVSVLLVASTIFTSIAWTHYYIILVIPLLVLLNLGLEARNSWLIFVICTMVLLNIWPIALDPVKHHFKFPYDHTQSFLFRNYLLVHLVYNRWKFS